MYCIVLYCISKLQRVTQKHHSHPQTQLGLKVTGRLPPAVIVSASRPSGSRNSDRTSSWLDAMAERRAGLTISLVEKAAEESVGVTGIWQNFPVKFGGHRQRSFCRQTPPFLQSRGQRTAGGKQTCLLICSVNKYNHWFLSAVYRTTAVKSVKLGRAHTQAKDRKLQFL